MPTAAAVTAFLGQYAHSMLGCVQLREYMHTLCTIKSICAHTLCAIKPSLALIGYQRTRNNHHMVIMWWLRYSLVKGQTNKGWFSINDIFRRFAQIRVWGCSILKKWQLSDFWRKKNFLWMFASKERGGDGGSFLKGGFWCAELWSRHWDHNWDWQHFPHSLGSCWVMNNEGPNMPKSKKNPAHLHFFFLALI